MMAKTLERLAATNPLRGIFRILVAGLLIACATDSMAETVVNTTADPLRDAAANAAFYGEAVRAIVLLFVLAILIESALAVIFHWRLFLEFFSGRGVRTLVQIAVSALVVRTFQVDVFHKLLNSYGLNGLPENDPVSFWLTALILAGGSAGVYNLLVQLGYRNPREAAPEAPHVARDKAWISIRVIRQAAVGDIYVYIGDEKVAPPGSNGPMPLAGVVGGQPFWNRLWSVFFLDNSRFPRTAGYVVNANKPYRIAVEAKDATGLPLNSKLDGTYTFAEGAIIDLVTTL